LIVYLLPAIWTRVFSSQEMNREIITKKFASFEETHKVDTFKLYGINVWPIIRIKVSLAVATKLTGFYSTSNQTQTVNKRHQPFSIIEKINDQVHNLKINLIQKYQKNKNKRLLYKTWTTHGWPSPTKKCDVVILTYPNRLIKYDSIYYHTLIDPLVEKLGRKKIPYVVWERSGSINPRIYQPSRISELLEIEFQDACKKFSVTYPSPSWFEDFASWAEKELGFAVHWENMIHMIRQIVAYSAIMQKWLAKTECKTVVTDCWYNIESMAAILAASRLGIRSIDFQHGLQGDGHFAYSSWKNTPAGGYALRPDRYWVWSRDEKNTLMDCNSDITSSESIMIGGNLWLNKWIHQSDPEIKKQIGKANQLTGNFSKVLLVTLQTGINLEDLLIPAIQDSPPDWLWLIRVHRQTMDAFDSYEKKYANLNHAGVNVSDATRLPLYTLFHIADIHITGYSTCAIEATAFHVPTILIHPSGKSAFQKYIDHNMMMYADRHDAILNAVDSLSRIDQSIRKESADNLLNAIEQEDKAIQWLVQ